MIDSEAALRTYLLTNVALTTLAPNIVASLDPPTSYDPTGSGGLVLFKRRGGSTDESSKISTESYQFQCIASSEQAAVNIYRALFDALERAKSGGILQATCDVLGELTAYPETEWPDVISFFTVMMRT